ncbi:ribonuclease III [Cyanobium sp. WAJ14-Wanaka]|uniref:ribonuclease III n=1 Tax=Cyanobium sp. WAJ14-Wanaka TaxID=2823725 RepID=UPI0020CF508B|nr:ribonuclease III [Cyanobium sp. WAJ14-Wanaka]MCP9775747.1 ribonuclease III [Cyanobium sp. WAJ14-Wanaka]
MNPDRRQQLVAFLQTLGVDPLAPGGPGAADQALAPVEEALTHSSTGRVQNHERLEFLGDAVLRLAASDFLQQQHGELSVGRCSALRAQLVSDRWLAELGERCGIDAVLQLGPMASGDLAGKATVRAECAEALIGALYEAWGGRDGGGLQPVHQWLTPHWQAASRELLADPDLHNWKSALQEWSQAQAAGLPSYSCSEQSQVHADPKRFRCTVAINGEQRGEGSGPSRRAAEQDAARVAIASIRKGGPGLRPARGS